MASIDCDEIAIIGAAGRFPGADNLQQYWELLLGGQVVVGDPDRSRTELWQAMRDPALAAKITTLKAGYLNDIAGFDADYFSVSPREAAKLDPQQRMLMETVRGAFEDAGLVRADLQAMTVGVFIGAGSTDYLTIDSGRKHQIDAYHGIGNSHSLLANRLSYYFNLTGPSLCIDTACSSSLTALHVAMQALRNGEVDLAIVGGVNAIVSPDLTLAFSQAKMLSPSGRCNAFSAGADGYGRAEAVGAVVLSRRAQAHIDNRRIRCVIRASAVNQDGRSNGITAPNGHSQIRVIQSAMARAGVNPADMAYMETHGTGTPLGDAIEFGALKTVFSKHKEARCFVGSAKANFGHAEAAAGMCGLLKAMLMLEHNVIPPHPADKPYSNVVDNAGNVLSLCESAVPMTSERRCIGISSFGFGGSNAHVIIDACSARAQDVVDDARPALIVLSSHYRDGLAADARALAAFIASADVTLPQIADTLCFGRDHLPYRKAWVVANHAELLAQLNRDIGIEAPVKSPEARPKLAFVFTGQGAQYPDMGRELYERSDNFRREFDACASLINERSGVAIAELLYDGQSRNTTLLLENTHLAQLALFCLEYALAKLWMSAGIKPDYVIGHSVGELVAHAVAGRLSLPAAVALLNERATLMQKETHAGAMLAVFCELAQVTDILRVLDLPLYIAAVNGKKSIVVSGDQQSIERLGRHLSDRAIIYRSLAGRHAFHSPFFECAADALNCFTKDFNGGSKADAIPVVSNLDGRLLSADALPRDYWGEHIVRPVQFAAGVNTLVDLGVKVFLEIGPDRVLSQLIQRDHGTTDVCALSSVARKKDSESTMLQAAGSLFEAGFDLQFDQLFARTKGQCISLPTRHLRRKRYWTTSSLLPEAPAVSAVALDADLANDPCDSPTRPSEVVPEPAAKKLDADSLHGMIDQQIELMKSQLTLLDGW